MLLDTEIVKQEKEIHNALFWAVWRCGARVYIWVPQRNPHPNFGAESGAGLRSSPESL